MKVEITREKLKAWLKDEFTDQLSVCDLLSKVGTEVKDQKRAFTGNSGWQYQLAESMILQFPEVVDEAIDHGTHLELSVNWKVFDTILVEVFKHALQALVEESDGEGHG